MKGKQYSFLNRKFVLDAIELYGNFCIGYLCPETDKIKFEIFKKDTLDLEIFLDLVDLWKGVDDGTEELVEKARKILTGYIKDPL